jgi:hypothetical protein
MTQYSVPESVAQRAHTGLLRPVFGRLPSTRSPDTPRRCPAVLASVSITIRGQCAAGFTAKMALVVESFR